MCAATPGPCVPEISHPRSIFQLCVSWLKSEIDEKEKFPLIKSKVIVLSSQSKWGDSKMFLLPETRNCDNFLQKPEKLKHIFRTFGSHSRKVVALGKYRSAVPDSSCWVGGGETFGWSRFLPFLPQLWEGPKKAPGSPSHSGLRSLAGKEYSTGSGGRRAESKWSPSSALHKRDVDCFGLFPLLQGKIEAPFLGYYWCEIISYSFITSGCVRVRERGGGAGHRRA